MAAAGALCSVLGAHDLHLCASRCVLPADPGPGAFFGEILIYVCFLDCITTVVMSLFFGFLNFGYNIQNCNLLGSLGLI